MERPEREERTERTASDASSRVSVREELEGRLRHQGVQLRGDESDDQLASLSEAVELFEDAVIAIGGDRFIDSTDSSEPDHPDLVLPARRDDESVDGYVRRVREAAARIARRPAE